MRTVTHAQPYTVTHTQVENTFSFGKKKGREKTRRPMQHAACMDIRIVQLHMYVDLQKKKKNEKNEKKKRNFSDFD